MDWGAAPGVPTAAVVTAALCLSVCLSACGPARDGDPGPSSVAAPTTASGPAVPAPSPQTPPPRPADRPGGTTSPSPAAAPEPPPAAASPAPARTSPADPAPPPPSAVPPAPAAPEASPSSPAALAVPSAPGYASSVGRVTAELAERMRASWRPGCPVPLADLRYVTVTHWTFAGGTATGELVVHAEVADGLVGVFATLFDLGYPVAQMRLVDDFAADDDASMAANNTSAFNCRPVTGGGGWSEHSYGRALDLNPVQNPYVLGGTVLPPAGARYLDRPDEPGVLHAGDAVVGAFAAAGWSWGGAWTRPVDYQHFSTTGR